MISTINDTVWVRGTIVVYGSHEQERWSAKGVYTTETAAAFACTSDDDFILQVEVNKPFPLFAIDALKMYYPFLETWETSTLYKMRSEQHPPKQTRPTLRVVTSNE